MADSTIAVESVVLISKWPDGRMRQLMGAAPLGGFTGSAHHNVASPAYPIGAMSRVWNDGTAGTGVAGWSTLMYGQNATTAIAAELEICQPASATSIYSVSSTVANAIIANDISPLMAVSISAMTLDYYGWFWVEGVTPSNWVTALATGDLPTSNAVIAGLACCGAGAGAKGVLEPRTSGTLDYPTAYSLKADV